LAMYPQVYLRLLAVVYHIYGIQSGEETGETQYLGEGNGRK
jgi:hypothetical protein